LAGTEAEKRKTVVKTLRFPESLAHTLEKEAVEAGINFNAMANSIISEHFDWDKKVKEFGFISFPRPIFLKVLEELDNEALARIGRDYLAATWREMAEFWFGVSSPERILDVLKLRSRLNPGRLRTRIVHEEGKYTIVLRHDFGEKWSIVEKSALQEFVRKSFLVEPKVTIGESVVTVRFTINPRNLSV